MQLVPQLQPITNMQKAYNSVIGLLTNGPVFLTRQSETAAVLVDPGQWNDTAMLIADLQEQLDRERRLRLSNQRYAAFLDDQSRGVDQESYDEGLASQGLAS